MKGVTKNERPREKLQRYGPGKLSEEELLAILLGSGIRGTNVFQLARKILKKWPENSLSEASIEEIQTLHGLGVAKACEIVASIELGRRLLQEKKNTVLLSPREIWERTEDIRKSKREHLVVFYLDSRSQELKRELVSIGTLEESLAHPREIFEQAVKQNAAGIIIAHNHPSGDPSPSKADLEITRRLLQAGQILGIKVVDHMIVTQKEYRSILPDIHADN